MRRYGLPALAVAVSLFASALATAGDGAEPDRVIEVEATDFEFSPDQFEVQTGQTVKIVLTNEGNVAHSFSLKHSDGESQKTEKIQPGDSDSFVFTAEKPGETEFICEVAGHAKIGMKGTIDISGPDG